MVDLLKNDVFRDVMDYDSKTGSLTWRVRPREHFATSNAHATWNAKYAGGPSNNRINNLRVVTNTENQRNRKRCCKNTSGVTGVYWHKQSGFWNAIVRVDGRQKQVGGFRDFKSAVAARKLAERKLGYHSNHDRPS